MDGRIDTRPYHRPVERQDEGIAGSEARAHGWGGGDVLRMIFFSFESTWIAGVKTAWIGLHG